METVIKVENLSKQYRIGARESYKTFRETLVDAMKAPFVRLSGALSKGFGAKSESKNSPLSAPGSKQSSRGGDLIWALKDVSFEVQQGEVIGIIGRNGAGKSTLLKILSRITEPTEGRVELRGRVGSLLEVGTGFHPELTGHENIYLYGAILGMDRWEVTRKFDEIVAFAELEKFIDTPVKKYSSGMYMRLAFAVAAHLEPEILLVDEVLAVGDAEFQKKCLGKMGEVSKEGRTVLFVSHNIAAVNRLCHKAIWLDAGKIQETGPPQEIVTLYIHTGIRADGERQWSDHEKAPGDARVRLLAVRVLDADQGLASTLDLKHPFYVEIEYEVLAPLLGMQVGFSLSTFDGVIVFVAGDNEDSTWFGKIRQPGHYVSKCKIPGVLLNSGIYSLSFASDLRNAEILFRCDNTLKLNVEQTLLPAHSYSRPAGVICPPLEWHVTKIS